MDPKGAVRELMGRAQRTGKMYSDPHDESSVVVIAEEESSIFPVLKWRTLDQNLLGQVVAYYGDVANLGFASFQACGPTTGDEGIAELAAVNTVDGASTVIQVSSKGTLNLDLRGGSNTANSSKALVVKSQTGATNTDNTALYVDSYCSGTVDNGFGTAIVLRAEDSNGGMIDQVKLVGSWKDKTAGTADAYFQMSVSQNSSWNSILAINKNGNYSLGGSGITHTPAYFIDINDGNDLQMNVRADASSQNDDGFAGAPIDYGEFVEKQDYGETLEKGDLVFIKGRKASKRGKGTPMIVSTYAGIRGGDPMQWGRKWITEAEYRETHGEPPETMDAWEAKHGKQVKRDVDGKPQPREPFEAKPDGRFILNPEWNPDEAYTPRSYRTEEWIVVAFAGQVPVKVRGKVVEGDYILPSGKNDGYGKAVRAAKLTFAQYRRSVGVAWGDKKDGGDGTVMVTVGVK